MSACLCFLCTIILHVIAWYCMFSRVQAQCSHFQVRQLKAKCGLNSVDISQSYCWWSQTGYIQRLKIHQYLWQIFIAVAWKWILKNNRKRNENKSPYVETLKCSSHMLYPYNSFALFTTGRNKVLTAEVNYIVSSGTGHWKDRTVVAVSITPVKTISCKIGHQLPILWLIISLCLS